MQGLINLLALVSFVGTASLAGGGAYIYFNREGLIESVKEQVTAAATEAITEALPGMIDSALPEIPGATGDILPSAPSSTGGVLPF